MIVLGIDAAFRNMGLAIAELDSFYQPHLIGLELVQTEKSKSKQVRKNSDTLRRAQELVGKIALTIESAQVDLVFAEVPTGSQSASASWSLGCAVGVLASISKPLIQVQPAEVKLITGTKHATKREMIDWAVARYPDADWLRARGKPNGNIINDNEHLADAVAAIHAGLETDEFARMKIAFEHFHKSGG